MREDERKTSISGPNVDGDADVEVEWVIPDAGLMGRDKHVKRSEATHARITSVVGDRVVTKAEAEDFIANSTELAQEKKRVLKVLETNRSLCRYCDDKPRVFRETVRFQTGSATAEYFVGEIAVSNLDLECYLCRRCGSMEFFDSPVEARYKTLKASVPPPQTSE